MRYTTYVVAVALSTLAIGWTGFQPSIAHAALTCSCPATTCQNGNQQGCSVECAQGSEAICVCDASCDDNGNPTGLNRCRCQPVQTESY